MNAQEWINYYDSEYGSLKVHVRLEVGAVPLDGIKTENWMIF